MLGHDGDDHRGILASLGFVHGCSVGQDKLIHMGEYTILGLLVSRAMVFRVPARGQVFLFTFLIAGAFGALDEFYQTLIPGRDSSYGDWVADIVGVALGSSLYLLWKFYRDQAPAG